MDRMLRAEIIATVRQTVAEVMEGADEVWLSPEDMSKQFSMFTPEWLRRHGELLPREKVRIVLEDGTVKESRSWAYPKHKINRLIMEGRLREIRPQCSLRGNSKAQYKGKVGRVVRQLSAKE